MPRDGAVVLSDLRNPTRSIVCEPCGGRRTYNVARLMEQHGDAKLTDLLPDAGRLPQGALGSRSLTDVGHAMSVTRGVEPPPLGFRGQPRLCPPRGSAR